MRALGPRPGERSTMSFLASYVGIEIEFPMQGNFILR